MMSDLYWKEIRSKVLVEKNYLKAAVGIKVILTHVGNSVHKDVTKTTYFASKVSVKPNAEVLMMTQLEKANHIQKFEKATRRLWLRIIWRKELWHYNLHNRLQLIVMIIVESEKTWMSQMVLPFLPIIWRQKFLLVLKLEQWLGRSKLILIPTGSFHW